MEAQNVIRKVKHELTNEEKHLYGVSLAEKIQGKKTLEDEKKASNSEYKALLDEVQKGINETSATINSGHEFRDIECKVEKDYSAGRKVFTDIHTGDIVAEETLSPEEMQTSLDEELDKTKKGEAMAEAEKRQGKTTPEDKPPKTKKGKAKKTETKQASDVGSLNLPPEEQTTDAPPPPPPEEGTKKDSKNEFKEEPFPKPAGQPSLYDSEDSKEKGADPASPAI